jgi:hypothetical protein
VLDGEFFCMNAVSASDFERRNAPIHRPLEGWSAGDASANLVAQTAKVGFQWRRFERFRDQAICDFFIRIMISRESEKSKSRENQQKISCPSEFTNHSGALEINLPESESTARNP